MKFLLSLIITLFATSQITRAQDITGGGADPQAPAVDQPASGSTAQVNKLTLDEQLKLRAAQRKAAEDPEVRAALAKRDQAIETFRKALHDAMVKADPNLESTLQKIAVGQSPGF
ncbi:MAG: hypothetical protein ABI946_10255 [Chthoniobacterales bacterium]